MANHDVHPQEYGDTLEDDFSVGVGHASGQENLRTQFLVEQIVAMASGELGAIVKQTAQLLREKKEKGSSPELEMRLGVMQRAFHHFMVLAVIERASQDSGILKNGIRPYTDRVNAENAKDDALQPHQKEQLNVELLSLASEYAEKAA